MCGSAGPPNVGPAVPVFYVPTITSLPVPMLYRRMASSLQAQFLSISGLTVATPPLCPRR